MQNKTLEAWWYIVYCTS